MCFEINIGKSNIFNILSSVGDVSRISDFFNEIIKLISRNSNGKISMSLNYVTAIVTASVIGVAGTALTIPVSAVTWVGGAVFGLYSEIVNSK